ncbi:MAG: FAD-binding protein [Actinomyces sp.]|nr:MAG: FAD-binding protein [Actinomyces sp.]
MRRRRRSWQNWAGNQVALPTRIARPASEDELAEIVRRAGEQGRRVRAVGAGHSFTDVACTDGVLCELDDLSRVLSVDHVTRRVTVGAGIRLHELSRHLDECGLALPNLGDIDRQSIAGAIATGTHGTGIRHHGIADAVVAFRLVTATGEILECSADATPGSLAHELWRLGRVSLGALGILSTVTLACVPAFRLRAVEASTDVDALLAELDEHVDATDHFEFYWVPHTRIALTKHNQRTTDPPDRRRWRRRLENELVENVAFGAVNRVGRRLPALVPRLARLLPGPGRRETVAPSHEIFCTRRRVRFLETEWGLPRAALPDAFAELRRLVDTLPHPVNFPVEVRFLGADDAPLSMAVGRETAFVACHAYVGTPYEAYFAGVEAIMADHGGRPHWGKLHRRGRDDLMGRYPELAAFIELRDRMDPAGRFANAYLDRVLGPVPAAGGSAPGAG